MGQQSGAQGVPPTQGQPWLRADKINLAGVITAALVAFIVSFVIPFLIHVYQHHFRDPYSSIATPANGQVLATNRIAVKGTAGHIPPDSDLWLSASGPSDEVYPIAELQVNAGQWGAAERQVCFRIGPGPQRIDVWISPDTSDGSFVAYMQTNHSSGFSSVPAGFIKLDQVTVYIRHAVNNC